MRLVYAWCNQAILSFLFSQEMKLYNQSWLQSFIKIFSQVSINIFLVAHMNVSLDVIDNWTLLGVDCDRLEDPRVDCCYLCFSPLACRRRNKGEAVGSSVWTSSQSPVRALVSEKTLSPGVILKVGLFSF